jgi:hypothetical protein
MSTVNNVESVANQQGSFKPSIAREGPLTDKGVSLIDNLKSPFFVYIATH